MKLASFTTSHDNNFNLVRFCAATAVLVSHSFALMENRWDPCVLLTGITLGSMAVHVFFATSGFLVTASLLNRRSLLEYFCARALRIYPGLFWMILVTVLGFGTIFTNLSLPAFFKNSETHHYIIKNATMLSGAAVDLPGVFSHNVEKGEVNGPLWSIPVELRFYIFLGGFWIIFHRPRAPKKDHFKVAIVTFAAGIWILRMAQHYVSGIDSGYPELLSMFFGGAAFYILKERIELSRTAFWIFAGATGLSLLVNKDVFFTCYNLFLVYMLLYLACVPGGWVRNFNRLGDYSYGIYIYGYPVQQAVGALFPKLNWWQSLLAATPCTLVLAAISWHLVEKKALAHKSDAARWLKLRLAAVTGGIRACNSPE